MTKIDSIKEPTMDFSKFPTTAYFQALNRSNFMDYGIKSLWDGCPIFSGPAFTVQLAAGDNLMFHAALYQAPKGSVIVADAVDCEFAIAGGNVCAIAKKRGIAGFIIDGVIRDIGEIKEMQFPVFARGVVPVPGKKDFISPLNMPIKCGGASVNAGDIIVADEDGVVVLPAKKATACYKVAQDCTEKELNTSLDEWEIKHRKKIAKLLESNNNT
jgi:4-hydroxy-4-methyl-2-oxoglutarate aldolase